MAADRRRLSVVPAVATAPGRPLSGSASAVATTPLFPVWWASNDCYLEQGIARSVLPLCVGFNAERPLTGTTAERLLMAEPSQREIEARRRKPVVRHFAEARISSEARRAACGRDRQFTADLQCCHSLRLQRTTRTRGHRARPNDAASIARNRLSLGSQVPPRATKRSVASTIRPLRSPSEGGLRNLPSTRAIC